jgi:hypothetical protein
VMCMQYSISSHRALHCKTVRLFMTVNFPFVWSSIEPRTSCTEPERCLLHAVPDDRKSLRTGRTSREKPTESKHEKS